MNSKLKTLLSVSIIIIITIFLHYIGWLMPIENFFRNLIKPGSEILYSVSINIEDKTEKFDSVEKLKEAYLKSKNDSLQNKIDYTNLKILEQENKDLREQLDFKKRTEYETTGAEVIGKNIDPLGNTIIINKGNLNGITLNSAVITNNGILIGKIVRVEKNISIVKLINDNQSKIAATIINTDRSIGLVEGGYGISVRMNFIPQNEDIFIGDTVITSGLEKGIPKGLLIGTIEAIEKEAYQPFQKAILNPLTNLEKISLVSVIKFEE